jgi:hypothetical protein
MFAHAVGLIPARYIPIFIGKIDIVDIDGLMRFVFDYFNPTRFTIDLMENIEEKIVALLVHNLQLPTQDEFSRCFCVLFHMFTFQMQICT